MLLPVILSGGSGTRLWPVSRQARPKPFIRLADGKSLLQKTLERAVLLNGINGVLTITNREHFFATRDEYRGIEFQGKHYYLLEPSPRNTAPAIAMGAFFALAKFESDVTLLVLPADHLVEKEDLFVSAVEDAELLAAKGYMVTFGVKPTYAETDFGYIECGNKLDAGDAYSVKRFVEKPELQLAQNFVSSRRYLWNSGMFCFKAGVFLDQLKACAPQVYDSARVCWESSSTDSYRIDLEPSKFCLIPEISIDYAVMEKSADVVVVPSNFEWSDIGTWNAVSQLTPADSKGNRVIGDAILMECRNSHIRSESRMVAALGVDDLIIVDTPDALLVARRDHVQNVRKVVERLKSFNHPTHLLHNTVHRPWGTYTVLEEGVGFKIKRIIVKPGASLSLQMHHHRSEHWVVVSGTAKVVNGERNMLVGTNESTFISAGTKHRLENPGSVDLVIIEVQSGDYLGEDDIVRFDDVYGRNANVKK